VISRTHGYHGVTLQAMSATGLPAYWKMFEPRCRLHPGPDLLSLSLRAVATGETAARGRGRAVEEAILAEGPDYRRRVHRRADHGGGGVIYPTDDYFPRIRAICDKYEVLFIGDEVITGSAAPARGSRSATGTSSRTSSPSPRASRPGTCRWRHHGEPRDQDVMDSVKPEDK
jgi:adenosylmethionine-8-amino-7-oxononanoate aminotransferase